MLTSCFGTNVPLLAAEIKRSAILVNIQRLIIGAKAGQKEGYYFNKPPRDDTSPEEIVGIVFPYFATNAIW